MKLKISSVLLFLIAIFHVGDRAEADLITFTLQTRAFGSINLQSLQFAAPEGGLVTITGVGDTQTPVLTAAFGLTEPGTILLPLSSITVDGDNGLAHLGPVHFSPRTDMPIFIVREPTVEPVVELPATEVGFFVPDLLSGEYRFLLAFRSANVFSPDVAAYDLKSEITLAYDPR